jgi:hypothetical protein
MSLEKQYNETNINKLFEQAINKTDIFACENNEMRQKSIKSVEGDEDKNKKELKRNQQKITEKIIKNEDEQKKTVDKSKANKATYQMEVEKISLSFTNINLNDIKQMDKKENNDQSNKDLNEIGLNEKQNLNNVENKMK